MREKRSDRGGLSQTGREEESAVSVSKHHSANVSAGAPRQVRIIGGAWKRTPLPVANAAGLRPTPDRVRETLFNWLAHLMPELEAVRGLDLFAGTGALGFELASRGARHVTLVEQNTALLAQLARIKQKLAATQVELLAGDALATARRWPDASFDLIFLDPPFDAPLLAPALAEAARLTRAGGFIYAESGAALQGAPLAARGLEIVRSGRAGRVFFHLLRRATQ
jgi:16S rRNA (guanine(966)-N(2))-methyltransferase RsmD